MSIQVESIDIIAIKERLRKEDKEAYWLVTKLEEGLKRQQELTALAISKLRKQ